MPSLSSILATAGGPSPGTIHSFAGSAAPTGWLLCDGSAVSRTTYATLFAAIGTSFGAGDGSTTFNLPNTAGLFLRSSGSQTVSAKSFVGGSVGAKTGHTTAPNGLAATTSCTPTATVNSTSLAHTHSLSDFYGQLIVDIGAASEAGVVAANSTANQADTTGSALSTHSHTAIYNVSHVTTLSSSDTETAPAAISLNFIIKT